METITIVSQAHTACTAVSARPEHRVGRLAPLGYLRPGTGAPSWMSITSDKSALVRARFGGVFVGTDAHQGPNTWGPPV